MNRHIIELTATGPLPKELVVDELDAVYFKNLMTSNTTVKPKKGLLKPKGKFEVEAETTSKRRTVKKHPSGSFDYEYTISDRGAQSTRSGTIRI